MGLTTLIRCTVPQKKSYNNFTAVVLPQEAVLPDSLAGYHR
jgi:hypothetical protein